MKTINIRKIEEQDKVNYIKLFTEEDFGCTGINQDLKPSIYKEEIIITNIINKKIINTEILVIEVNEEFVGYASITRQSENKYHIGQFVITKKYRNQGYGASLMNRIKEYAAQDNCSILLECISVGQKFFEKQGFNNLFSSAYAHPVPKKLISREDSLFVNYELIKQQEIEEQKQEQKTFNKFLQSPLFKHIMDMV